MSEGIGDAISEVIEVAGLCTGTIVGLAMRNDEATDTLSALQMASKHKQTRCSCNTIDYTLPAKYLPLNLYMYYYSQQTTSYDLLTLHTNYTAKL